MAAFGATAVTAAGLVTVSANDVRSLDSGWAALALAGAAVAFGACAVAIFRTARVLAPAATWKDLVGDTAVRSSLKTELSLEVDSIKGELAQSGSRESGIRHQALARSWYDRRETASRFVNAVGLWLPAAFGSALLGFTAMFGAIVIGGDHSPPTSESISLEALERGLGPIAEEVTNLRASIDAQTGSEPRSDEVMQLLASVLEQLASLEGRLHTDNEPVAQERLVVALFPRTDEAQESLERVLGCDSPPIPYRGTIVNGRMPPTEVWLGSASPDTGDCLPGRLKLTDESAFGIEILGTAVGS